MVSFDAVVLGSALAFVPVDGVAPAPILHVLTQFGFLSHRILLVG